MTDETAKAVLLMSAARLALSTEPGDPEVILRAVAHRSLPVADVHRHFATLIEAVGALRALRPYTPDGDDACLTAYDHEVQRAVLVSCVLLFGEPDIDNSLTDAESVAA